MVLNKISRYLIKQPTARVISRIPASEANPAQQTTILQHLVRPTGLWRTEMRAYHTEKPPETVRLYSQNIKGIMPGSPHKLISLSDTIKELEVDIACLQEVNDTLPRSTRSKLITSFSDASTRPKISISTLSPYQHHSTHQPGGNMVILRRLLPRKQKDEGDMQRLGRWAVLTIATPNIEVARSGKIRVLTAYRANAIDSGDNSTLNQQRRVLLQQRRQETPQKAFEVDIIKQMASYHSQGDAIILTGDFNCPISDRLLRTLSHKFSLVDVMSRHMKETPPTRDPGSKTIDHVLVSTTIVGHIQDAQYLPFRFGVDSDHRAIVVDISEHIFEKAPPESKGENRKLSSRKIHQARQYKTRMTEYLRNAKINQRLQIVEGLYKRKLRRRAIRNLELVDRRLSAVMRKLEKEIKRHQRRLWSPEIRDAAKMLHYWQTHHRALRRGCVLHPQVLERLEISIAGLDKDQGQQGASLSKQLKAAKKKMREANSMHRELRNRHMQRLMEERSAIQGSHIKAIRHAENMSQIHRNLNLVMKPSKEGIQELRVQYDSGEETLTSKDEIDRAIHLHNTSHFAEPRSRSTPFSIPPLLPHFGFGANTKEAREFARDPDHKIPNDTHPLAKHIISKLRPHYSDPVPAEKEIKTEDLTREFTRWREKTHTSPEGTHLGHYKVWLRDFRTDKQRTEDEESGEASHVTTDEFFGMQALKLNLAIRLSHPLRRWRRVHMILVPKDRGGIPSIKRLRAIDSFDAEVNLLRRIFVTQRTMRIAERQGIITPHQWGGRFNKQCADLSILKELVLTMMLLTRRDGAITEVDATACFDKIPPALMSLSYCKAGLPPEIMTFLSKALLKHRYHTVTSHGVSTEYNCHSEDSPFFGPGQGSADGTVAWALIHDKIDKVYSERATGAAFSGISKDLDWRATMAAFVDDVSLFHMSDEDLPLPELEELTSAEVQLWIDLLWAASGKSNLHMDKTYSSIIRWAYTEDGTPFLKPQPDFSPTIREPPAGPQVQVHTISPYEAKRSLGLWRSKDLTSAAHLGKLNEKQITFSKALTAIKATPYEAMQLYRSVYYAQIGFSLPSISLKSHEIQSLQSQALTALLRKVKLPITFPRALVFASTEHLGLGVPELGFQQGYTKIQRIISHLRMKTPLSALIKIVVEWYQLHAGIQESALKFTDRIGYVHCPWIGELREFMRKTKTHMVCPSLWTPKPQREGDECIMNKLRGKTGLKLERVNSVRLYHKVLYVSDITSMDGKTIINEQPGTTRELLGRSSSLPWPEQQKPGPRAYREWTKALRMISSETLKLKAPLGKWFEDLDSDWKYKISPNQPEVLKRKSSGQITDHQLRGGGYRKIYDVKGTPGSETSDAIPAPTEAKGEALYVRGELNSESASRTQRGPTEDSDTWKEYFNRNANHTGHEENLNISLHNPGAATFLVTDGGAELNSGYYGWLIATEDTILVTGTGRLACADTQLQSLRPETTSYLACTTFLYTYLKERKSRVTAKISHHVDNMTVVRRLASYNTQTPQSLAHMMLPDMDIQLQIQENLDLMYKELHVSIQSHHVRGHQDKTKKVMSWEEKLNVKADDLAAESKDALKPKEEQVPAQVVALWSDGHMITTKLKKQLHQRWSLWGNHAMERYLFEKYKWDKGQASTIDWEALPQENIGVGKRAFVTSYTHQWLPLNERLKRRGAIGSSLCPICDTEDETDLHFLSCRRYECEKNPPVVKGVVQVMKKFGVDPHLRVILTRGLKAGRTGKKEIPMQNIPAHYQQLVRSQQQIGWDHLWYARWTKLWGASQAQYLEDESGDRRVSRGWITQAIRVVLNSAHERWMLRGKALDGEVHKVRTKNSEERLGEIYKIGRTLPVRYHFLIRKDMKERLEMDPRSLQRWIQMTEPIVRRGQRETKKRNRVSKKMEAWLRWRRRRSKKKKRH